MAETRPDQAGLRFGPPSPRCLASYRVSPACWFREFALNFPRTLVQPTALVPFLPELTCCSRQRSAFFPEARPDTQRAPFDVRWTVARDTSRSTFCSPSHSSVFKDEHPQLLRLPSCFKVSPAQRGEQPSSRWATRFDRLSDLKRACCSLSKPFHPTF
jgi:hypothetical protein